MPTKSIDRLVFAQGGECFFCREQLPKADASVEHLVAVTHGGKDNDENCVACCKALNMLFGRMSLKEKLRIVLNQRGSFVCPAGIPAASASIAATPTQPAIRAPKTRDERLALVVADLQKRGNAKPGTVPKLLNTIRSQLSHQGEPTSEAEAVFNELAARAYVSVAEDKVKYQLPTKAVSLKS